MKKEARILFMGTPGFAVASLDALVRNDFIIPGVITVPDKPAGRGRNIIKSAVAEYAENKGLELLQPEKLKDPMFLERVRDLKPDIAVVVAFRMLPEELWKIPGMGTFNLHASLLPQYRGAAPINHVIINGEKTTGNTTFLIDKNIDTGNILLQEELEINPGENAGLLHDRLMIQGAELVVKTVKLILSGNAKPSDQQFFIKSGTVLKTAPKIFPADCYIDWSKSAEQVYNLVRGMSPYPGARTILFNGKKEILLKILEAEICDGDPGLTAGTIVFDNRPGLKIKCRDAYLDIKIIQPEGKKVLKSEDYLRGVDVKNLKLLTNLQA